MTSADGTERPAGQDPHVGLTEATAPPWRHTTDLRITGVRAIVTAPEGVNLIVVRVDTSDDGLYGLGCATFTQRHAAVVTVVEDYLAPLVTGRHPADISDLTRMVHHSSYWRSGPVLNNALSGLDLALWDIAGKRAGMAVHDLLGGRVRAGAPTYLHASGETIGATVDDAARIVADGWQHVRLQTSQPGAGAYGAGSYGATRQQGAYPGRAHPGGWDVPFYLRQTRELFATARQQLGEEVELLHDVHSRLGPREAVGLGRALEEFRPYFLEDVVPPELYDQLPAVRAGTAVPLAVGELCVSVADAARLVTSGSVDFLRCHLTAIGGLTPGRKLTALCELLGARTAWHLPGDVSPIGAAASLALDVTSPAFGIQEGHVYSPAVQEVFPGTPNPVAGTMYPSDQPGWGVDLNEREAAKYPPVPLTFDRWAVQVRGTDGGLLAP